MAWDVILSKLTQTEPRKVKLVHKCIRFGEDIFGWIFCGELVLGIHNVVGRKSRELVLELCLGLLRVFQIEELSTNNLCAGSAHTSTLIQVAWARFIAWLTKSSQNQLVELSQARAIYISSSSANFITLIQKDLLMLLNAHAWVFYIYVRSVFW